ncbi:hypothetical protein EMIHUDRAFT_230999 [Emiliania huxleyi CCMP1516]|uniref:SRP54-type proteins GTP-binding domain-containing protein n=2 Tax=Emiliania huxleyi TaxID=2903 RepID=A0A0D3K9J2_EMIH1|nr:hypothetical protein EMIHUDRAFT_230999 [Emiliania huxleyi CCMP1516]EOD32427.1 hypothetical protein EMIHUDRAFT_230999 [Emiliania huxleyi CCMP1516]|eukprot:XP_005784856.1 hypothetical protein EMIHUDRAFT_230999 [Emiliania huxleyi CCMP1516]
MLDRVCVVGSSGVVRWSKEWAPADGGGDIVGELICRVLLEERAAAYGGGGGGVGLYSDGKATVRWVVLNEANLLVAAVHQASLVLPYVEALLRETAGAFAARQQALPPEAHDGLFPCDAFSPAFDALVAAAEERAAGEKRAARKQRTFAESKKHEAAPRGVAACTLSKLVGGGPVTAEAMAPVLKALLDRLVEKNVAQEVGAKVIDAVGASLVGASLPTFGSLASTVKAAMAEAFGRARGGKRPYVVVFVGVNGVGKSTSLSKVAYYIKSNGFVPLLCACDTFRSGAVEQLRVHAQALDVPLFQKGYGNDAAQIAADGIAHAQAMGATRRLVDTAG